jgi:hypothetical protein
MYNQGYLIYVAKSNISEDHHELIEKIAAIVPESGILNKSISRIAHELGCSEEKLEEFIDLLFKVKPVIIQKVGDTLVFDYDEAAIKYVRHLRNAISNRGLLDL